MEIELSSTDADASDNVSDDKEAEDGQNVGEKALTEAPKKAGSEALTESERKAGSEAFTKAGKENPTGNATATVPCSGQKSSSHRRSHLPDSNTRAPPYQ